MLDGGDPLHYPLETFSSGTADFNTTVRDTSRSFADIRAADRTCSATPCS